MSEIVIPKDREALVKLGRDVADHEAELPEGDRLKTPSGAAIRTEADECDRANRASDRYRRLSEMETKKAEAAEERLETALRKFAQQKKQVTDDVVGLQEWGFEVVEHAPAKEEPGPATGGGGGGA